MTDDEEVLVCIRATDPTPFTDNQFGQCADCGTWVQFRPMFAHMKKLCIVCVKLRVATSDDDPEVVIDPRSLVEIHSLRDKNKL